MTANIPSHFKPYKTPPAWSSGRFYWSFQRTLFAMNEMDAAVQDPVDSGEETDQKHSRYLEVDSGRPWRA